MVFQALTVQDTNRVWHTTFRTELECEAGASVIDTR